MKGNSRRKFKEKQEKPRETKGIQGFAIVRALADAGGQSPSAGNGSAGLWNRWKHARKWADPLRNAACRSLLRQVQPDVEFAQLLCGRRRGRPHEQILGALVHREERHLAQVLLA